MAYHFTSEQQAAIDTRDRTLLVSAAAGSGKTATLTERIIRSLTDPEHPTSLCRLVVATFTNDSAADMRRKIARALDEALARDPKNSRLAKEQLLMPSARISTIDSFCVRLLRRYAEELGLSPSFRVAEPAEAELLAAEVMEELLEDLFGGECEGIRAEEFCALTELLSSPKSEDDLPPLLLSLYEDVLCEVRGVETLADAAALYRGEADKPFLETVFGAEIADSYAKILSDLAAAFGSSLDLLETVRGDASLARRIPFCRAEAETLVSLAAALRARDRAAAEAVTGLGSIPPVSRNASDVNRALGTLHTEARERLAELRARFFSHTEAEISLLLRRLSDAADLLYRILSLYDARLSAEKRRRGLLGFSDIERYTCALLSQGGEPTPLARELSLGIDQIYIDEFQDVNALQYTIFKSLSRGDNLFMVGDVKQCIYAFRHADPTIFSALRAAYPPVGEEYSPASTLFFSRNFRCDGPIVRYVNRVAGGLLRAVSGGAYTVEDELVLAKPEPRGEEPVHTHVFELPTKKTESEIPEGEDPAERECLFVAEEIARLLREGRKNDGSPIRPSDITLLFRTAARMPQFAAALSGIAPVVVSAERDFFLNPEVLLALSLLYVIDNPRRDIYLAAALRSPVFDFTLGDLCTVRTHQKALPSLYDALLSYCEANPDFEKGKRFLSQLSDWRRLAEGEAVGALVLRVLGDAGLLSLAGEGTTPHHDNLYRLYQYARSFEASSYEGLYSFISYINTAIEQGATVLKPAAEGKADAVRFMTVHGSKGLEFPVVFLCDAHHPFNLSDTRTPLLYDREYGPVLRFPNDTGTALTENPIRALVAARRRRTAAEEEIRLLYVALTRARERLYVTGATTKLDEKLETAHKEADLFLDWKILSRTNCLAWILPLLAEGNDPYLRLHYLSEERTAQAPRTVTAENESENGFASADLAEELYRRLTFVYPDEAATRLPEKLSVSRLSPTVLDGSEEEAAAPIALPEEHRPTVPVFLSGKREDEAALAGTATHLFMQFSDLTALTPEGVEAEIARLVTHEFMTPEDAARVRRDEVAAFCRSALFSRLAAAKRLRRELRFHATLPAEAFTTEEARAAALAGRELLVQGVIDCILEEEEGYTVIDYKTDRLTPAELADKSLAAEKLTRRHADQLAYYAAACTRMFGKPPRELLIYSLPLGDTVRVECPAIV